MSALAHNFVICCPQFTSHLTLDQIEARQVFLLLLFFACKSNFSYFLRHAIIFFFFSVYPQVFFWFKDKMHLQHILLNTWHNRITPHDRFPGSLGMLLFILLLSLLLKHSRSPPPKYLKFFGGPFKMTVRVVLLEKQPFLIKHGLQMKR